MRTDATNARFAFALLAIAFIIGFPFLAIWAVNALGADIPYTAKTWSAMAMLLVLFNWGATNAK